MFTEVYCGRRSGAFLIHEGTETRPTVTLCLTEKVKFKQRLEGIDYADKPWKSVPEIETAPAKTLGAGAQPWAQEQWGAEDGYGKREGK